MSGAGRWPLFILLLVYMVNSIDRSILNVLGQAVKEDLQLTDLQLGLLGGVAFSLVNAAAGIPFARLAERFSRVSIISAALAAWSLMTAACGMTQTFWQLFAVRVGVGVGEAGAPSPSQSLISDLFPPKRRALALSVYMTGIPLGLLLGALISGWVAEVYGWRTAFVVVGLPGVLLAVLMFFTVKEPLRGQADGLVFQGAPPKLSEVIGRMVRKPTYIHMLIAGSLLNFATYGILQFLHPLFVRAYGMGYGEAATVYGMMSGISLMAGMLLGGVLATALVSRDQRFYLWVPGIGVAIAAPLYVVALFQGGLLAPVLLMGVAGAGAAFWMGPWYAAAHNLTTPQSRATVTAISALVMNALGVALGPVGVGYLSDLFSKRAYGGDYHALCSSASSGGLSEACIAASGVGVKTAIGIVALMYVWSAIHFFIAARTLRRDLAPGQGLEPALAVEPT